MAKYSKGILGPISGTVGTVVGSSWRAIDYVRSKATKYTDANTDTQRAHRGEFKLIAACARGLLTAGRVGLRALASRKSEFNILVQRLFDVKDELEKLRISTGVGPMVQGLQLAVDTAARTAKVTWTPMAGRSVYVAVVATDKGFSASARVDGAAGEHTFSYFNAGVTVKHAYAFSADSDGKDVSDTAVVVLP